VLLATITSNLKRRSDPAHLFIDIATPEGKQTGLNQPSLVSCINIATLHAIDVGPKIGELSARGFLFLPVAQPMQWLRFSRRPGH